MTTTKAYFENINDEISKELEAAKHTIHIAVAWFTDDALLRILIDKAEKGLIVSVIIVDDEINKSAQLYHKDLKKASVQLNLANANEELMHNKFCVIDNKTVITGSYNWTINAQFNNENILVIKDNPPLASSYLIEYYSLLKKYVPLPLPQIEQPTTIKMTVCKELNFTEEELKEIEKCL